MRTEEEINEFIDSQNKEFDELYDDDGMLPEDMEYLAEIRSVVSILKWVLNED